MARSSSSAPLRMARTMLVSRYCDQLSVGAQVSAVRVMRSMSRHARYMYRCSGIGGLGLHPRGMTVKLMGVTSALAGSRQPWHHHRAIVTEPRLGCDPSFRKNPAARLTWWGFFILRSSLAKAKEKRRSVFRPLLSV